MSRTPVVLFSFSRVSTTARVLERIAQANPPLLFVVLDAPRPGWLDDAEGCAAVRRLVTDFADVGEKRYEIASENLGPRARFASGLRWVFDQVSEAIVLEDDCLPDPTFFGYCDELLERYREDERIMMISGDNYQFGQKRGNGSYYFSNGLGTHGWATWRRAMRHYDVDMRAWPEIRQSRLLDRLWPVPEIAGYWRDRLDEAYERRVDTWDFPWALSIWSRGGLQVVPNRNLVSYIGCLPGAANTTDDSLPFCDLPTESIERPLVEPLRRSRDLEADLYEFYRIFALRRHDEAVRLAAAGTADAAAAGD